MSESTYHETLFLVRYERETGETGFVTDWDRTDDGRKVAILRQLPTREAAQHEADVIGTHFPRTRYSVVAVSSL